MDSWDVMNEERRGVGLHVMLWTEDAAERAAIRKTSWKAIEDRKSVYDYVGLGSATSLGTVLAEALKKKAA